MSIDLNQQIQQVPLRVASPQLVAANHILALSSTELQALIHREVEENPAIDVEEIPVCPQCSRPLQGGICPVCTRPARQELRSPAEDDFADEAGMWRRQSSGTDEEFDPTTRVAAQMSLAEHLTLSLQAQYTDKDAPIIEYLVGNLDDDGRLHCNLDEMVSLFDVDERRVKNMIRSLQSMEPVGVGAQDLRECLLIQLQYLEAQGLHQPFAREVISRFLPQLSEHKYGQIALALGTTTETIHEVSEFIRRNLNPFPARGYLGANLASGGESSSPIVPDVIISKRLLPGGVSSYDVEVVESKRFFLNINPSYAQLYADASRSQALLSDDERRHIHQYVARAKLFISNIDQRRKTLTKITRHLVQLQRDFLEHGIRALVPLTRAKVALDLGMHESTVSRATAAKYCMLPSGEVIPFSNFFVANLGIKDMIKDLIDTEVRPLTDQDLAGKLSERGVPVARRTVAKYREQLGILPSTLR
jgi:RNA polymerase sigma-54 factor